MTTKTVDLKRPYRGWLSGRQLWEPGKRQLNEDAARYLVNAGYAEYVTAGRPKADKQDKNS
jgi:hypothetical protein